MFQAMASSHLIVLIVSLAITSGTGAISNITTTTATTTTAAVTTTITTTNETENSKPTTVDINATIIPNDNDKSNHTDFVPTDINATDIKGNVTIFQGSEDITTLSPIVEDINDKSNISIRNETSAVNVLEIEHSTTESPVTNRNVVTQEETIFEQNITSTVSTGTLVDQTLPSEKPNATPTVDMSATHSSYNESSTSAPTTQQHLVVTSKLPGTESKSTTVESGGNVSETASTNNEVTVQVTTSTFKQLNVTGSTENNHTAVLDNATKTTVTTAVRSTDTTRPSITGSDNVSGSPDETSPTKTTTTIGKPLVNTTLPSSETTANAAKTISPSVEKTTSNETTSFKITTTSPIKTTSSAVKITSPSIKEVTSTEATSTKIVNTSAPIKTTSSAVKITSPAIKEITSSKATSNIIKTTSAPIQTTPSEAKTPSPSVTGPTSTKTTSNKIKTTLPSKTSRHSLKETTPTETTSPVQTTLRKDKITYTTPVGQSTTKSITCESNNGGCPVGSVCRTLHHGSDRICKCPKGYMMQITTNECILPAGAILVSGMKLEMYFLPVYKSLLHVSTVELTQKIEGMVKANLLVRYSNIGDVQITKLEKGSVVVTLAILFREGPVPKAQKLVDSLSNAIEKKQFKSINVVSSSSNIEAKVLKTCQSITNPCKKNSVCASKADFTYECKCKSDYTKNKEGKCIRDSDIALKIALPIILVSLFFIAIGACIVTSRKRSKQFNYNMCKSPPGGLTEFENKAYCPE